MSDRNDQAQNPATPNRIRQAQADGQIPLSRELASGICWLGGLALLLSLGPGLWQTLRDWAARNWSAVDTSQTGSAVLSEQAGNAASFFWGHLVPLLGGVAVLAAAGFVLQTRFGFFPKRLVPDWDRLNPGSNVSRIFSLPTWITAFAGLGKLLVLSLIAWWVLAGDLAGLLSLSGRPLESGLDQAAGYAVELLFKLVAAVCLVGVADYGFRWWYQRRRLQMTDQEIRDERRATEAPPEIDARRRLVTQGDQFGDSG